MRPMSTDPADDEPYRQAAAIYYDAGWIEPLPLPFKRKWPPPDGFTGRHPGPSRADVQAWIDDDEGRGNIAIRLPENIVGLDVDAYHEGATTFAGLAAQFGELPPTWRSTSRDDGSAIYFYRVPPHLAWPGQLGAGIEVIQAHHRYAVVWPSVHPEGNVYRWYDTNGLPAMVPPDPDLLPLLPQSWVEGVTRGQAAGDPIAKADLAPDAALAWLKANSPDGESCRRVQYALAQAHADLAGPGSAHEAARGAVLRLINLAADHHTGVSRAVTSLANAFLIEVSSPARDRVRTDEEARGEWFGLVMGAIAIGAAKPTNPNVVDPCDNPFAGIMPPDRNRLTGLSSMLGPMLGPVPNALPPSAATAALDSIELPDPSSNLAVEPATNPLAEVDHSTWWPLDLAEVWDGGDDEGEAPSILARSDGAHLFYRGQVNGFIGESESGKTWLAYEAVRQVLDDGGLVQVYDFEDSRKGAVNRLRALGVARDALERLSYVNPDEPVMGAAAPQAWADLATNLAAAPDLIVIDGFNAAMGTQGLDMDKNTDVTAFIGLLRKMAATGAAVVTVDHVPKNPDGRLKGGIGAQAKRAGVTGATIRVEVDGDAYPAPGKTGMVRLSVDKDRRGGVREHAAGKHLAMVTIASDAHTRRVAITLLAPDPTASTPPPKAAGVAEPKTMEALADVASTLGAGFSKGALLTAYSSRKDKYPKGTYSRTIAVLRASINALIEAECFVEGERDIWHYAKPYNAREERERAALAAIGTPDQLALDDDEDDDGADYEA